jgi:hypothetical protein
MTFAMAGPAHASDDKADLKIAQQLQSQGRNAAVDSSGTLEGTDAAFRELAKFNPKGYDCDTRSDTGHINFTKGSGRDLFVKARVSYKWCWPVVDLDRLYFVEPEYTRGSYNIAGTHWNCNSTLGHFQFTYLEMNMYFFRKSTGANFNPGPFNIPCDDSTRNSVTQFYTHREVPRLYVDADNTTPVAKANVTIHKNGPDEHKSHAWHFNP